jgi:glycine cleavage system H lipoate-binding protein
MRCPFLREAQVKSCQASTFRKQIVRTAVHTDDERCVSPDYVHCVAVKELHEELPSQSRCPFLQESLVQYCSAAPVAKFIPYSDSLLSRCGSSRHRYCDLYLTVARPQTQHRPLLQDSNDLWLPANLRFSHNHLWIDVHEDGTYQIGVDALLAFVFGSVERVTCLPQKGKGHPTALVSVHGQDYQVVFPVPLTVTGFNSNLRVDPGRLIDDPYGHGWIFEGNDAHQGDRNVTAAVARLMTGDEAVASARADLQRLSAFVQERTSRPDEQGNRVLNDGGLIGPDLFGCLPREEALELFHLFFSPYERLRN